MLCYVVKMLGKYANDPCLFMMEKLDGKIDVSFDEGNTISKLTVSVNSVMGTELLHSISSTLNQGTDKKTLVCALGEPTYILNFPQYMKEQVIVFYDYAHFWIGLKLEEGTIQTISVLSPSIIPDVIKLGHAPIRICRS